MSQQSSVKSISVKNLAKIAMVASIYAALSIALAPLSYGPIQVRIAEALTVLPLIWKPSIISLSLGCFITNLIGVQMGSTGMIDIVIGTAATLLAAIGTRRFKDIKTGRVPLLSLAMPVIINGILVGLELSWMLFPDDLLRMWLICGLEVAAGETVSVIAGWMILPLLTKTGLFKEEQTI